MGLRMDKGKVVVNKDPKNTEVVFSPLQLELLEKEKKEAEVK